MKNKIYFLPVFLSILFLCFFSACSTTRNITDRNIDISGIDTIRAQRFDMGKMWTFENPPVNYFQEEYDFTPDSSWFAKARKSALKFGKGCSASFVSEDGLIMTNHHCVRGLINKAASETEDFLRDGFIAKTISKERKIPDAFVQQLFTVEDVSDEVLNVMGKGKSDEAKILLRDSIQKEIVSRRTALNDSLNYSIVTLYNGGKFSLYGYKRYSDVRLVFTPDIRTAAFGGDYDNFTYPRHNLDCAFLRVYENDEPLKSHDYFKWSTEGAASGEPVFVIGNPGSTERLKTIAQLEYDRDVYLPPYVNYLSKIYDAFFDQLRKQMEKGEDDYNLLARLYSIGNTLKVNKGVLEELNDPGIMMRKKDFENKFKLAINGNADLKSKYSNLWDKIKKTSKESGDYSSEISAYALNTMLISEYFNIASRIVRFADQLSLPEDKRANAYKKDNLDYIALNIFPANFNPELENKILTAQIKFYNERLGEENPVLKEFLKGKKGQEAVDYLIDNCKINSHESVQNLLKKTPDQILNSGDPFIKFIIASRERNAMLKQKNATLQAKELINKQLLGKALFAVYGETIPPDATGTLRIADGVVQSYSYNGTIAPVKTTFNGVLDKYFSFNKKFPFDLPSFWEHLPAGFDLNTPLNFISTNDIIGGNSGSPVVNKNLEVVGLAFDGNIESLSGRYIYTTEENRTISVHSKGLIEAISHLYNLTRISNELLQGKITN